MKNFFTPLLDIPRSPSVARSVKDTPLLAAGLARSGQVTGFTIKTIGISLSLAAALSLSFSVSVALAEEAAVGASVKAMAETRDLPVRARVDARGEGRMEAKAPATTGKLQMKQDGKLMKAEEKMMKKEDKTKTRAGEEIDRRIKSLTELRAKIGSTGRVSSEVKSSLSATIASEIKSLTELKAKISAGADAETLKADVKSVTASHRIFALVVPQGRILAAADKINATAEMTAALGVKLEARINAAKTEGKDVAVLERALVDLKTKIAEAKAKATVAIQTASVLKPDNGDNAVFQANKKALAEANVSVKDGNKALKEARKAADTILKAFKSMSMKASVKAESKTSATVEEKSGN